MDNTDMATCSAPELSSISMREEEIGRHSAQLLMERILRGWTEKQTIRLQPELIPRASSRRDG